jgi:ElaB/YqjD/DUF883 family membrane-anchored ribosome-binding protein
MATAKSGSATGTVAEVKEKGAELVSSAQEQVETRTEEVREEAAFRLRDEVDERSSQVGEQIQAVGQALLSGVDQLRTEGKGAPADVLGQVARRADTLGDYLKSADADQILADVETFARRRPWVTAGAAALAGFLASRVVKASSDRRYEARASGNGRVNPTPQSFPGGGQ